MKYILLLVLIFFAVARSEDCVSGWTYAPDPGANIIQQHINGAWTLIRGRTTYHQGWIESDFEAGPCIY